MIFILFVLPIILYTGIWYRVKYTFHDTNKYTIIIIFYFILIDFVNKRVIKYIERLYIELY